MIELASEKTMTISEIIDVVEASQDTILRRIKKHFPEIIRSRETTRLTEKQVELVTKGLRHRQPQTVASVASVASVATISDDNTAIILQLIQNQQKNMERLENKLNMFLDQNKQIEAPKQEKKLTEVLNNRLKLRLYVETLCIGCSGEDRAIVHEKLWDEVFRRLRWNVRTEAYDRGFDPIRYVEVSGMEDTILAIAQDFFQYKKPRIYSDLFEIEDRTKR